MGRPDVAATEMYRSTKERFEELAAESDRYDAWTGLGEVRLYAPSAWERYLPVSRTSLLRPPRERTAVKASCFEEEYGPLFAVHEEAYREPVEDWVDELGGRYRGVDWGVPSPSECVYRVDT